MLAAWRKCVCGILDWLGFQRSTNQRRKGAHPKSDPPVPAPDSGDQAQPEGGRMSKRHNQNMATPHGFIPLKGGDEHDALTRWRKYLQFGRGVTKWIKRKYNKRVRRAWRDEKREVGE
jgi:hypothetical protein